MCMLHFERLAMRIDELDYNLPQELIAQRPLERRDASRMLVLDRRSGLAEDRVFADFPNLLRGDELLVCNNARVIPARLFGRRAGVHSQQPSKSVAHEHLLGHVPLPPYIERDDEISDRSRYQTVFAKRPGAVAAPTAGLHFTPEILEAVRAKGVETCELTLDVGLGTFQPIHVEDLKDHVMHGERYEISPDAASKINNARRSGKRILAVGTTVVRALEDAAVRATNDGSTEVVAAGPAEAKLFITPGFSFRIVDELLTNFHLPRATLLALVCAFAGKEHVMRAYCHAVEAKYRFYSYGDCMLIRDPAGRKSEKP